MARGSAASALMVPLAGTVSTETLSLPALTLVVAGLDAFNRMPIPDEYKVGKPGTKPSAADKA